MSKKLLPFALLAILFMACESSQTSNPGNAVGESLNEFKQLEKRFMAIANNRDSTRIYSQKFFDLSKELGKQTYTAKALKYLGFSAFQRQFYDSAQYYLNKSIDINREIKDTLELSASLALLGKTHQFQTKLTEALENYQEAARLRESAGSLSLLGKSYNEIATVLSVSGLKTQAITNYEKAIAIAEQLGDLGSTLPPSLNISLIYLEEEAYEKALNKALEVKQKSRELGTEYGIAKGAYVAGNAYLGLKELDKAVEEVELALAIFQKLKSVEQFGPMATKADIMAKKNQPTTALKIYDQLLQNEVNQGLKQQIYQGKYELYKKLGKTSLALQSLEAYNRLYQEITQKTLDDQVVKLQTAFESNMKSKEIQRLEEEALLAAANLKNRNLWLVISAILLLATAIAVYLIIQNVRAKAQKKLIALENKLLRSQLNPHFIFNAMAAIQEYIYAREEPQIIADYLARFSGLTRMILNYSRQEYIYLSEEIDFIEDYINLQQVRFEQPFDFELRVAPHLNRQDIMLPPLLTQPFIENAIEHGLLHRKSKGHISLIIEENDGQIHILVEDNGIGRKQAAALEKRTNHQSVATQMTKERLMLMQKRFKKKTQLLITDLFDGHSMAMGTRVSLFVPLIKEHI